MHHARSAPGTRPDHLPLLRPRPATSIDARLRAGDAQLVVAVAHRGRAAGELAAEHRVDVRLAGRRHLDLDLRRGRRRAPRRSASASRCRRPGPSRSARRGWSRCCREPMRTQAFGIAVLTRRRRACASSRSRAARSRCTRRAAGGGAGLQEARGGRLAVEIDPVMITLPCVPAALMDRRADARVRAAAADVAAHRGVDVGVGRLRLLVEQRRPPPSSGPTGSSRTAARRLRSTPAAPACRSASRRSPRWW